MIEKGDIVLVPFPFTDLSGSKRRPALILRPGDLDVIVCFISTQLHWQESTDILLQPNEKNGLKKPSLVRVGKIATLSRDLFIGRLGKINDKENSELNLKLAEIFEI